MNPLIQNGSRGNNVKLLNRRLKFGTFDVFLRGSTIFIGELDCKRVIYQYLKTINTF